MPTEKQLDEALEDALRNNVAFVTWFLGRTKQGADFPRYVDSRFNYAWGKVRVILPNPVTGALEAVEKEGETDVLAVFEGANKRRLGLHIENKLAAGSFTEFQPERYAARADAWRGKPDYWSYDVWETVLVAPNSFFRKFAADSRKFTTFISHEELTEQLPGFAQ